LTCDFWAENEKRNCKDNKRKQIHFGDDNQNGNGNGNGNNNNNSDGKGNANAGFLVCGEFRLTNFRLSEFGFRNRLG
jgi:hypothetical protein